MIINAANLDVLRTSFTSLYDSSFLATQTYWQKVAMATISTGKTSKYGWLGQFPSMKEWIGNRVVNNLISHDFTITNKKFESTIGVRAEDIEDDTIGEYAPLFQNLGDTAARHPDEQVFGLVNNVFSTICYDGQNFIDTDHPVLDVNGVQQSISNDMGGSGNAWFLMDASRPIKPFIFQKRRDYRFRALDQPENPYVFELDEFRYGLDSRVNVGVGLWQLITGSKQTLTQDNYALARQNLIGRYGDGGKPLALRPNILLCGTSNEEAARQVIKAERSANGASNIYFNDVEVMVVPYLP